eukprot:1100558_1
MAGVISKCEIKVSYDGEASVQQSTTDLHHTFPAITQFNIPVPKNEILITHHLFCRPTRAKGIGFLHIKSFTGNTVFGEYAFNNQNTNGVVRIN